MGRAAQWLLAIAAAPLFIAFAWQGTIASVGDDSVSYLAMARWFAGSAGPLLTPWLPWHSHFPPLFPMVLAATGAAHDVLAAHLVVAAFAIACIPLVAQYAALRLQGEWRGFWVAAAFLALPTTWISMKGILSEPLYLALSLGALIAHEKWLAGGDARPRAYVAFGVLLALAYSTRVVALTLVAAFVIHVAVRARSVGRVPRTAWLALLPLGLAAVAWPLVRPGAHVYAHTIDTIARSWLEAPLATLQATGRMLIGGWLASFVAEGEIAAAVRVALYAVGLVALAGSVRAAMRNRIDGWYVLLTLALLIAWVFGVENARRLFYPVMPLALLHAAEIVIAAARRLRLPWTAVAAACAFPFALCAPATVLVAEKSLDRAPLIEGAPYSPADITDYYQLANRAQARALAAKNAATLAGLEALRTKTPPGARVMWMRPEYVALLGEREGVASYYEWDARTLAVRIRDARVDYLVVAGMSKSDLAIRAGEAATALRQAEPYGRVEYALDNPFTGQDEFILLRIDRPALDAYLAAAPLR